MQEAQRHLIEVMGRTAPRYDRAGPRFFADIAERLLRRARIEPATDILDVATGPGILLAQLAGHGGRMVGVDLSQGMIAEARSRLTSGVELFVMDAESLDFADASFDRVLCSAALQQLPDPGSAVNEFRRVLRRGGIVAAAIFGRPDPRWRGKDELYGQLGLQLPRLGTGFDAERLRALLENADFDQVEVDAEHLDVRYTDIDAWVDSAWSHGERRTLEAMDGDAYESFLQALPEALAPAQQSDGRLLWRPEVLFAAAVRP